MTFLILSTFIFWPYLVHRPNFRPCAPPEFKANHRNLTFFVSFGPIPECNSAASWIRPLLCGNWTPLTVNIYVQHLHISGTKLISRKYTLQGNMNIRKISVGLFIFQGTIYPYIKMFGFLKTTNWTMKGWFGVIHLPHVVKILGIFDPLPPLRGHFH